MTLIATELQTADGIALRGQQRASSGEWVLFFHDVGEDLDCWRSGSRVLAKRGYSCAAVDLRGHGLSEGSWDEESGHLDILASAAYARQAGARSIALIGVGALAVSALAVVEDVEAAALVAISPRQVDARRLDDLRGRGVPKLFFGGGHDMAMRRSMALLRRRSIGPAVAVGLPTSLQGTHLLRSEWATTLWEYMSRFLDLYQRLGGLRRKGSSLLPSTNLTTE